MAANGPRTHAIEFIENINYLMAQFEATIAAQKPNFLERIVKPFGFDNVNDMSPIGIEVFDAILYSIKEIEHVLKVSQKLFQEAIPAILTELENYQDTRLNPVQAKMIHGYNGNYEIDLSLFESAGLFQLAFQAKTLEVKIHEKIMFLENLNLENIAKQMSMIAPAILAGYIKISQETYSKIYDYSDLIQSGTDTLLDDFYASDDDDENEQSRSSASGQLSEPLLALATPLLYSSADEAAWMSPPSRCSSSSELASISGSARTSSEHTELQSQEERMTTKLKK